MNPDGWRFSGNVNALAAEDRVRWEDKINEFLTACRIVACTEGMYWSSGKDQAIYRALQLNMKLCARVGYEINMMHQRLFPDLYEDGTEDASGAFQFMMPGGATS